MQAYSLRHGATPYTTPAFTPAVQVDDYDSGRALRGIMLGLALSLATWAGLALALREALG
jgi:hypothetical protein